MQKQTFVPIVTQKFVRKPLFVEGVRVTEANFLELAFWCKGSIQNRDGTEMVPNQHVDPSTQHIQVKVHNPKNARQTKAMVGDWILYTERGYKVYTDKAFRASFDTVGEPDPNENQLSFHGKQDIAEPVVPEPAEPTPEEPVPVPQEPTPAEPVPVPDETPQAA